MTVWGEAEQQVTGQQRHRARVQRGGAAGANRSEGDDFGRALWEGGLLVPAWITVALDRQELGSPEVDIACGAEEPSVDHWELGVEYPTWEQTRKLAALCGVGVEFLCQQSRPAADAGDSLRSHIPPFERSYLGTPPITWFMADAIAKTLRAEHVLPAESD